MESNPDRCKRCDREMKPWEKYRGKCKCGWVIR